jgi:hypothetical protein
MLREATCFDFEKVLRRTVDFFKGLRASVWYGLHCVFSSFLRDSVGFVYGVVPSKTVKSRTGGRVRWVTRVSEIFWRAGKATVKASGRCLIVIVLSCYPPVIIM